MWVPPPQFVPFEDRHRSAEPISRSSQRELKILRAEKRRLNAKLRRLEKKKKDADSRAFIAAGGVAMNQKAIRAVMRELGRRTSPAKARAARLNGKLGGRPKKGTK